MRKSPDPTFRAIRLDGRLVPTPYFFPSVSSLKTTLSPVDAVSVLTSLGAPLFLVSAYDFSSARDSDQLQLLRDISTARRAGSVVMLDSGGYESYWYRDTSWTPERYYEVANRVPADLIVSFDAPRGGKADQAVAGAIASALECAENVRHGRVMPIVHLPFSGSRRAAGIIAEVVATTRCDVVAVPERELGDGLQQRIATVKSIRRRLRRDGSSASLHLLGTGNPTSILLYAVAGADSFDGLEWCQTVVDHRSAALFHFQQYDLFRSQTRFGDGDLPYTVAALAHNLTFYKRWLDAVRQALVTNQENVMQLSAESLGHGLVAPVQRLLREAV